MPRTKIRKFQEPYEVETYLNGGLIFKDIRGAVMGGTEGGIGAGLDGLVGKTLIFTSPAVVTVTFVASSGVGGSAQPGVGKNPNPQVLLFKDLKLQIEAAAALVKVFSFGGRLVLIEATPASGIGINKDGTANTILGIDTATNSVGKFYTPPPSAVSPCWTWMGSDNNNTLYVSTWE